MIEVQGAVLISLFFLSGFFSILLLILPLFIFRAFLRW